MELKEMTDFDIIRQSFLNSIKKFRSDKNIILIVYLFGSSLEKNIKAASDIDFAFLLEAEEYRNDPIIASYPAYVTASNIGLKFNKKTDVIILNSSSLEIAYEVIKTGRCLYEYDIDIRLEYEAKIRGMYFDFRPFLMDLRSKTKERIIKRAKL
ncbi:MAG: nucleotidyltransferase domain-containing protein [Deltaproteobacteria bacterium]|nr:nucleotidyltransferase domain-containing protein [Deltaproteobacteria bacterium]MBW2151165.1 nucleotidyltransferase domain-containing protein [Deltaproteobacteria bacterium]